jgi:molybdenum cofactor cytidylyltransferase
MSSSIRAGLSHLLAIDTQIDAVIITLCDQPYVTAGIIDEFIAEYRRIRPPVIASEYNGVSGVPALFSREMFTSILELKGDRGARSLIRSAREQVIRLNVPQAAFDIDTPEDLTSAKKH